MKLDLHIHTKYSRDGVSSPANIIRAAKKSGMDGVAITDHNNTRGWKEALEEGKRLGIKVIKGEEVKVNFPDGSRRGEILALFIEKEIKPGRFEDVIRQIRKQKGIAIVSHPFDKFRPFDGLEEVIKQVDGLEGFNSRSPFHGYNTLAQKLASKFKLSLTAGSDAHVKYEVGNGWTEVKATTLEGARKEILKGRTKLGGKKANHFVHFFSTLAKLKLIGRS
jgi:predicted metal-dependent phosphoesterase TrpH